MKKIIAILFAIAMFTGCATVQTVADRAETAVESVDWIKVTEGSLTAVSTLQKLGKSGNRDTVQIGNLSGR